MTADADVDTNLDTILTEVGEFGLFQIVTYLLICIPSALSASYQVSYMFSANTLEYRCKVPECDIGENVRDIAYDQSWLHFAIPTKNGQFDNCARYAPINRNEDIDECSPENFNVSVIIPCTEYIYASDEKNVQTEFNIHCAQSYDLALVGMINNISRFMFLPVIGILSDRFGRLKIVVYGLVFGSFFGLIKSYSSSYLMFLFFEFLESLGTSTFAGTFALALEWVNAKYRIVGSMIVSLSYPAGEILLSIVAMYVHDFRHWIRYLYGPGLLLIVYLWIVPESIRWLLLNGRVDQAISILKRTASVNGKKLSEKSIEVLKTKYSIQKVNNNLVPEKLDDNNTSITHSLSLILKSRTLCLRFVNCCYLYFATAFCYYGLSMSALSIPGVDQYISFCFVAAIEIPGILVAIFLLKRVKRRQLMFAMLFITAICTIVTPWIPKDQSIIVMISFMVAKASVSCTYNATYVYTAEQWPTSIRTTVMNFCSMFGKLGPMIAPMAVILATKYESLPAILYGCTAIVGSVLALLCPETHGKKLPDTIKEAKDLK